MHLYYYVELCQYGILFNMCKESAIVVGFCFNVVIAIILSCRCRHCIRQ